MYIEKGEAIYHFSDACHNCIFCFIEDTIIFNTEVDKNSFYDIKSKGKEGILAR